MRELTLRQRWLNGEDVVYDPILDMVLEEMTGFVSRMDDDARAAYCCLSDRDRGRFIWSVILKTRDACENDLMWGRPR